MLVTCVFSFFHNGLKSFLGVVKSSDCVEKRDIDLIKNSEKYIQCLSYKPERKKNPMPHIGETDAMSLTKADAPLPILFSRSLWHIVGCNLQMKIKKKTLPVKVVNESKLSLLFIFRGQ